MLRTIAHAFGHNMLVVLALAAALAFGLATQGKESVFRPTVVNANTLIAEHGCADQPNPTHAVVTLEGQTTRYVGQRLTDKAIEQEVYGIDHGMTVHAFCE